MSTEVDLLSLVKRNESVIRQFISLGIIKTTEESCQDKNIGDSDYSKHLIQPWHIWQVYKLNPWDADIVKRVLRTKKSDTRKLDYEKIIHIAKERIRQIDAGL